MHDRVPRQSRDTLTRRADASSAGRNTPEEGKQMKTRFCYGLLPALCLITAPAGFAQSASIQPAVAEWQFLASSTTPPTLAACNAVGIRCFTPMAMQNAYNVSSLYGRG